LLLAALLLLTALAGLILAALLLAGLLLATTLLLLAGLSLPALLRVALLLLVTLRVILVFIRHGTFSSCFLGVELNGPLCPKGITCEGRAGSRFGCLHYEQWIENKGDYYGLL
jgi:hypothetical protein